MKTAKLIFSASVFATKDPMQTTLEHSSDAGPLLRLIALCVSVCVCVLVHGSIVKQRGLLAGWSAHESVSVASTRAIF